METNIFRPNSLEEFIGQKNIINNLNVFVMSAQKRNKNLDHILIHGPSGLGKTSLGYLVSKIINKKIHILNGQSLQKPSDIISPLTSLKENEILFIDEIHSVSKEIFEVLYPVLEDNKLNIIVGKEYNSKVVNIKLANFTLIGATTEINKLVEPFKNRFSILFHFQHYSDNEITEIIKLNCKKLNMNLDIEVIKYISKFCQNTPRVAINLLKRIYDYIIILELKNVNIEIIKNIFLELEIYKFGLSNQELLYLKLLYKHSTLGIETIQQVMGLQQQIIIKTIEPILIRNFLIEKTVKGRKITEKAILWLEKENLI
ncbi:Holliday junction branch migration DNA helicase RuvB [Spiroplasma cantharicola]|uniref:Holliday junction branch migration complex subunit RuvB n=1 Tax=Spiroplasma cantharicola TaxID=362837 RepID=A0A0M4K1D4_9MOLU|nr:Holliday junction branch migration DNA helicase RuvB [Spiroplasma cantharicola]ALD66400.1 Holliday junction DNA helicase RuvB [Spiroplasma cantharicola]